MAAVVEVRSFHGSVPALGQNVTGETIRFKQADDDAQDNLSPIDRPASGKAYSWRKVIKLIATSSPDTGLENLRIFSDGVSLGDDRRVLFALSTSYVQPSAADEEAAISNVDVDSFTQNSPRVIQPGQFIGSEDTLPFDGGALQDYVLLQLEVGTLAAGGTESDAAKTLTYRYDET